MCHIIKKIQIPCFYFSIITKKFIHFTSRLYMIWSRISRNHTKLVSLLLFSFYESSTIQYLDNSVLGQFGTPGNKAYSSKLFICSNKRLLKLFHILRSTIIIPLNEALYKMVRGQLGTGQLGKRTIWYWTIW